MENVRISYIKGGEDIQCVVVLTPSYRAIWDRSCDQRLQVWAGVSDERPADVYLALGAALKIHGQPQTSQGSFALDLGGTQQVQALRGAHTVTSAELSFKNTQAHPGGHQVLKVRFTPNSIEMELRATLQEPISVESCSLAVTNEGKTGSTFEADVIFEPYPTRDGINHRRYGEAASAIVGLFSPPPFCLPIRLRSGTWLAVALEPHENQLGFSGFTAVPCGTDEIGFVVDYPSCPTFEQEYQSPPLVLRFGANDEYEALRRHAEGVVAAGKVAPVQRESVAWHRGVMACSWRQQIWGEATLGGSRFAHCTQEMCQRLIDRMEAAKVDFDIFCIDDFWGPQRGIWEADPAKWPDLRGFINTQHEKGRRVLLWVCTHTDGLPDEECYHVNGQRFLDPLNPAYLHRLRISFERMFGDSSGCYGADGIKFDFTDRIPGPGEAVGIRPLHGIEYLKKLFQALHDTAKSVRPDCLLNFQYANPYLAHLQDMTRLNDYFNLPEDGLAVMRRRARIAQAVNFGADIDTDHVSFGVHSYGDAEPFFRECGSFGNPSLYLHEDELKDPALLAAVCEGINKFRQNVVS